MNIQGEIGRKIQTYREREIGRYRHIGREKLKHIDIQGEKNGKIKTYKEIEIVIYRHIGKDKQ